MRIIACSRKSYCRYSIVQSVAGRAAVQDCSRFLEISPRPHPPLVPSPLHPPPLVPPPILGTVSYYFPAFLGLLGSPRIFSTFSGSSSYLLMLLVNHRDFSTELVSTQLVSTHESKTSHFPTIMRSRRKTVFVTRNIGYFQERPRLPVLLELLKLLVLAVPAVLYY